MQEAVAYAEGDQGEKEEVLDVDEFADCVEAWESVRLSAGGEKDCEATGGHGQGVPRPCKVLGALEECGDGEFPEVSGLCWWIAILYRFDQLGAVATSFDHDP